MNYLPFQLEGIEFIRSRWSAYLADQMGLGKTVQACGVINRCPDIRTVLVICPASVKLNWQHELETWCPLALVGQVMPTVWPTEPIKIINFDILHRYADQLRAQPWDLVVIDEAHKLINLGTRRTEALLGSRGRGPIPARRRLAMSGTPMVNRPKELFPILHWLDPYSWPSFEEFGERYCGGEGRVIIQQFGYNSRDRGANYAKYKEWSAEVGHDGKPALTTSQFDDFQSRYAPEAMRARVIADYKGASNMGELRARILGKLMIRRLKKDVLTQLPAKVPQLVQFSVNARLRKLLNREMELWEKTGLSPEEIEEKGFRAGILGTEDNTEAAWEEISTLRREAAEAKVKMTVDHLKDLLAGRGKVVCFVHHRDSVKAIAQEFNGRCVIIDGSTGQVNRQTAVERFQTDPSVELFIGTSAAAEGITLTASDTVVIAEWFWSPGIMTQMVDRCHRIGSEIHESILVQYLLLEDSMDVRMARTMLRKQMLEDELLN